MIGKSLQIKFLLYFKALSMDKLSNLIPRVLNKRGLKDEAGASYVTFLTAQWIEENLPEYTSYLSVSKKSDTTIVIESDHAIASQELSQVKEVLLGYINTHEGINIDDIFITRSGNTAN
jgi:hypothetical protein